RSRIEQEHVVNSGPLMRSTPAVGTLPYDLVSKILWPEHSVHQHLQVMARGRIAVQVDRSRLLQHTAQLDQTGSHHRKISHHVAAAKKCVEGNHCLCDTTASFDNLFISVSRL